MPAARLQTVVLAVVIGLLSGCHDTITSYHITRATAESDIKSGWIPSVLPTSTVNICESHNLDLNVGSGTFEFEASDADQFRAALTPLSPDQPLRAHRVSRSAFERRGYTFYRHNDFDIAVNWGQGVGEFWLVYRR